MKQQAPVVIIGSGLAGAMAALTATEQGAEVLLIDRLALGLGSSSALANGVFCGPTATYDPGQYVPDTLEAGRGLNLLLVPFLQKRPAQLRGHQVRRQRADHGGVFLRELPA